MIPPQIKNLKAFTISELLIGMTILTILSAIGFISLSNYNTQARDSVRLTDVKNITTVLNLQYSQKRVYPSPTDGVDVTYSGATVWTQGVFGKASANETGKIFGELKDPKYGNQYSYSVTSNKKEYQLGVLFEKSGNKKGQITAGLSIPDLPLSQTYASDPFLPSELNPIIWLDGEDINGDGNPANNPANGANISSWINKGTLGASGNPTLTHGDLMYTTSGYKGTMNSIFLAENRGLRLEGSDISQGDIFQVIQNRDPFGMTDGKGRGLQSSNDMDYTIGYDDKYRNSLRIANSPKFEKNSPATKSGRENAFIYGFHTNNTNYSYRESGNIISQGATNSISGQTWAYNKAGAKSNERADFVVSEILIFDQVLSETERQKVEGYLAHKWDMTDSLVVSHPYKNTPPTGTPTVPSDSTPDIFTFNSMTDVVPSTLYTSNSITVQGINVPVSISVVGGEYSIDGGVFTASAGTVSVGQTVQVRRLSSPNNSTTESVSLTIGGVEGIFSITTIVADISPDTFAFSPIADAELSTNYGSNIVTIQGINVPVIVSVSGTGVLYRIVDTTPQNIAQGGVATATSQKDTNNSPDKAFDGNTGTSGWGNNNQMPAILQYDFGIGNPRILTKYSLFRSSSQNGGWNSDNYSPKNWTFEGSNDGSSWTILDTQTNKKIKKDATKQEFSFSNTNFYRYYRLNISSNNHGSSNWVNITEMELISEENGVYTSSAGNINAGQSISVRLLSSSVPGTTKTASLTVGSYTTNFSVTTVGPDTSPDVFSFTDVFNASTSTVYESNAVTIQGINTTSPVSISGGGEYRINGGSYTSSAGNIAPGDIVQVRLTASSSFSSSVSTTLTIGGVSATYNISTPAPPPDTTPDAFLFSDISDAGLSTQYISDTVTVSGINTSSPVTIAGGQYRINNGAFTTSSGNIQNGDTIQLRVTSGATPGNTKNITLTIGGVADTWSVTTIAPDTTPDAFSITAVSNADLNTDYVSNPIIISGINTGTPISISGGSGKYSINGGSWRSTAGTVYNGDELRVQLKSSTLGNTVTSTTLNIGGVTASYSITTLITDIDIDPFIFQRVTGAFLSTPVVSDMITISGINTSVPISVVGGEYRIGSVGSFTSTAGMISNGDTLSLRLSSGNGPNISTTMTVTVGGYTTTFEVQTQSSIVSQNNGALPTSQVTVYGNYNGVIAYAKNADDYFIVATPSILTYDLSNPTLENILAEKKLVYSGFSNIPESYKDSFPIVETPQAGGFLENVPLNGGFDFIPEAPLLFFGSRNDLASYSGLKQIHEGIQLNYKDFIVYSNVSSYLDDYKLGYLENILSNFVGINPIKPYYCSDIRDYRLIDNIAPTATITASPAGFGGTIDGIANGVISSEGNLDYEYHSADTNASIFFEWQTPQRIGYVKIYNRTSCCSGRLSGANIKLYNESGDIIYSHPLWNTEGDYVIDLDLEGIDQLHYAKSMSIETVDNNYLNLREVEIYLGGELKDGFYKVDKDGLGGQSPYKVYCDMTTDGGGWTRIGENYITNGELRNQNHTGEHTFVGYNNLSDNVILSPVSQTPPSQIPDASVLRHNGDATESYQMFFDSIPGEYFAQEIRLRAWVKDTTGSVFAHRIEYADGTVSINQPDGEIIDTADNGWRLEQVRIPLVNGLVDNFYWNAALGLAGPLYMTGFEMEVYYK